MDHERKISVYYYQLNPKYLDKYRKERISNLVSSKLPSSVYILMAKPRGSRTVSAEPLSPARKDTYYICHSIKIRYIPTVEKRIKTRVFEPFLNTLALQISDRSSVASKTPNAPPLKNTRVNE
jgi:hypothetical protein